MHVIIVAYTCTKTLYRFPAFPLMFVLFLFFPSDESSNIIN